MDVNKKVLVGMSGGIDSSAVCLMLQEQGYEVVGLTMRVWDLSRQFTTPEQEFPDFIQSAKELAGRLGIAHYVADERESFKHIVAKNFIDEYMDGRTPNPCVLCNPLFKFRVLTEWADKLDCSFIATGHYVQLEKMDEIVSLVAGEDLCKDQSYFLWRLSQDVLSRCIFPLGALSKSQVREYLDRKGFTLRARQSESMEVCFIEGDYRDFLRQQVPNIDHCIGEGWFVDAMGRKLGKHKGFPYYTVGQRKGLGIALGKPVYVLKLNPEKNTVMLGDESQLETSVMLVEDMLGVNISSLYINEQLTVRIRYHSRPVACRLRPLDENRWLVTFSSPVSAVTPGQSAVFYEGDKVLGGAIIASQRGISLYLKKDETTV